MRARAGVDVDVLDAAEEARLAFVGATRTLEAPVEGEIAVADVGGGSSELAVGTLDAGVRWSGSFVIGSGQLADAHLHSDPPSAPELRAARAAVAQALARLELDDPPALALAVGGSATSLHRVAGEHLDAAALAEAIRTLAAAPSREVARRLELEPERVRLLPAGIVILEAIAQRLGVGLRIGRGGLREGVILEMLAAT